MNFKWLKKLFRKNSTSIAKIDTSFVNIPKLSELNEESKNKVLSYIDEINLDNYESILKYGEEIVDNTNKDITLLFNRISELKTLVSSIEPIKEAIKNDDRIKRLNIYYYSVDVGSRDYYNGILVDVDYLKTQMEILINDIRKLEIQAELRLIAFNEFIKKESKRKYDFLGIFGNAERLKYLKNKNSLYEGKERLLITIKIIRNTLYSACMAYKQCDYSKVIDEIYDYVNWDKNSGSIWYKNRSFYSECHQKKDTTNKISNENHRLLNLLDIIKKYSCEEIDYKHYGKSINSTGNALDKVGGYKSALNINANLCIDILKYGYNHRFDYKKIIEDINKLTLEYKNTSSRKLDILKLKSEIDKYVIITSNYICVCNPFLNDEIIKQIRGSLFNLNYFYYISNYKVKIDLGKNLVVYGSKLIIDPYYYKVYYNTNDIGDDGMDWDVSDEINTYNDISINMLNTLANLCLPSANYKSLQKRMNKVITELKDKGELYYLLDIYNNDYDSFDLCLKEYIFNDKLIQKYFKNSSFYITNDINNILLDDIFYLDKFLETNGQIINDLINDEKFCIKGMTIDLFRILVYSYFKNLDIKYDDQILVLSKLLSINNNNEFSIDKIKDNYQAIYVPNEEILEKIIAEKDFGNIKYLLIKESVINNLKRQLVKVWVKEEYQVLHVKKIIDEAFKPLRYKTKQERDAFNRSILREIILNIDMFDVKFNDLFEAFDVIVLPDDTKYEQLSKYLEEEKKNKNNNKTKVLNIKSAYEYINNMHY